MFIITIEPTDVARTQRPAYTGHLTTLQCFTAAPLHCSDSAGSGKQKTIQSGMNTVHHSKTYTYGNSVSPGVTLSLSLRFNGLFPGEPGLAGVYWSKGWRRWWVVATGAISRAKLQSNHHHQKNNTQSGAVMFFLYLQYFNRGGAWPLETYPSPRVLCQIQI